MRKLFTSLLVVGMFGAATAASAQDEHRKADHAPPGAMKKQDMGRPGMTTRTVTTTRRDYSNFRGNVQATQRFRAGRYRAPPGYAYRRWTWGQRLPALYWGRNYWITNFLAYGLMAPAPGLVWVRYGPDALLINQVTGDIVRVRYGVFY